MPTMRRGTGGDIVGAVGRRFEAGGLELRDHARRTQQEESFGRRVVRADVVDRGQRRGIHLLACGFDAQRFELVEVVGDALRRIVRQERVADAHLRQVGEEPLGPGEEGHAHVDGAVHIERHVPDAAGAFEKLLVRKVVKSGRMERAGLRKDTKSRGQKQTLV